MNEINPSKKKVIINYYLIGSKYKPDIDFVDVFPLMKEKSVVSTDFFLDYDFTNLIGLPKDKISKWIDKNIPKTESSFNTAKRTLADFINLQEGDIIAVKSHGKYGKLTIIAYAQVVKNNDKIYQFGDHELGHTINVEYLETGLNIKTGLTYGQTLHKIIPGKRKGHFESIFGSFSMNESIEDSGVEGSAEDDVDEIKEKNTESYTRATKQSQLVNQVHNKIQNKFVKYLKETFPNDVIKTEKRRIDVLRTNKKEFNIYEIKPYNSVVYCIREALGQVMDYYFSNQNSKKINLIIVGVAKPNSKDKEFINFLKSSLNLDINYECFDLIENKSVIY